VGSQVYGLPVIVILSKLFLTSHNIVKPEQTDQVWCKKRTNSVFFI